MTQIIDIVLPVFGLIAIGYLVAWSGLLSRLAGEGLVDFVFVLAIPLLIFRTIATADFGGVAPWRIWLPFFAAFALNWVIGDMMIRRVFGRDARAGLVAGVSAAYGNTVLVGIPLVITAYGDQGAAAITLIIAVHLPVMMSASAVLIGRAERHDGVSEEVVTVAAAARNVAVNLLRNPIIIGLLLGVAWRVLGLPLAGVPKTLVDRLADVAAPLASFAMGMGLRKYGIRRNVPAGLALSALKLILMPAVVLVLARYVVPMPPIWAKVAVVAAACPTGINAYLLAARFRTGEALASNAIAISTGLSVVTATLWLSVVHWF
jgi:malonate transporter and related proteins